MAIRLTVISIIVSMLAGWITGRQSEQAILKTNQDNDAMRWQTTRQEEFLGYENCRKCHQLQVDKLVTTVHFKSYETTHRSAQSRKICQQLGIRSIKRSERCIRCHYTPEISRRGAVSYTHLTLPTILLV